MTINIDALSEQIAKITKESGFTKKQVIAGHTAFSEIMKKTKRIRKILC